jgi:hypothetical protein
MWRATSAIATGTSWSAGGQRLTSGDGAQTEYAVAGYELDVGLTQPHGIRRRWAAVPLGMRAQKKPRPVGREAGTDEFVGPVRPPQLTLERSGSPGCPRWAPPAGDRPPSRARFRHSACTAPSPRTTTSRSCCTQGTTRCRRRAAEWSALTDDCFVAEAVASARMSEAWGCGTLLGCGESFRFRPLWGLDPPIETPACSADTTTCAPANRASALAPSCRARPEFRTPAHRRLAGRGRQPPRPARQVGAAGEYLVEAVRA